MRRFGLIGKTLQHSFSKNYFTQKFKKDNSGHCIYETFELQSISDISNLLRSHPDIEGLNVTIPYKEAVLPFLDEKNDTVQEIKACNCIKIKEGKLYGYNTDVVGFRKSLESKLKPVHTSALVLGSGGASKAVQYVLKQLSIDFKVISRQKGTGHWGYEDVDTETLNRYKLIINTTPVGMYPDTEAAPIIPYSYLTPSHFLFDLIYNPEKTKFLQRGEEQGAQIANGYEMLVLQAEESWSLWNEESV